MMIVESIIRYLLMVKTLNNFDMGEILPDGTIQGYQGYCKLCGQVIDTNSQGKERSPYHNCETAVRFCKADLRRAFEAGILKSISQELFNQGILKDFDKIEPEFDEWFKYFVYNSIK